MQALYDISGDTIATTVGCNTGAARGMAKVTGGTDVTGAIGATSVTGATCVATMCYITKLYKLLRGEMFLGYSSNSLLNCIGPITN